MNSTWQMWLNGTWGDLVAGKWIDASSLPHPSVSGFNRTDLAEDHGQIANWEMAATDGSRLHVHEHADGRLVVHRDPTNPSISPLHAAWHWLTESPSGRTVAFLGLLVIVFGGGAAAISKAWKSMR